MTDNRTTELMPCPICGKKVYIGLYDDRCGYWWMVHGGMHYDECHCRLFMESCKFELEDDMWVEHDEHAMGIRGGLAKRWNTRATHGTLTADDVRDLIERHSDASGGNGRDFHNGAYEAIADELNAELGNVVSK